jgi:hypothetical protein
MQPMDNSVFPSEKQQLLTTAKASKSPFSNYKSAALNQLSYAGVPHTKAVFSELIKSSSSPISHSTLRTRR